MSTLANVLQPGEKILWEGRAQRGLMLRSQDAYLIPFSIMWCGFAIFWEFHAVRTAKAVPFFTLWGGMFVVIGLYFVIGRFIVDAVVRAGTIYGVTNHRVLISSGLFGRETRSIFLSMLPEMRISQKADGGGTIKFGPDPADYRRRIAVWTGSLVPSFEGIDDVAAVHGLILKAHRAEASGA